MRKRYLTVACGLLAGMSMVYAQKKPDYKWEIYVTPEKQIFVHDSLPVYFFMSDKNDPTNAVRLESKSKYANPMEWDGHGRHYLRHKDRDLEHEILFEVWADGIKSVTTNKINESTSFKKDGKFYCKKGANFQLTAKDESSGVQATMISIDKKDYYKYTAPISLNQEKEYFFQYFTADNVGNVEDTKSATIVVDGTAPVSKHTVQGDFYNDIISARSKIELKSEDANGVAKIVYAMDGGSEKTYYSTIKGYSLGEGDHTLTYYAVDKVGNKEDVKTYKFFVDKTAPVVSDEIEGDRFVKNGKEYVSERSKYVLKATDNKAGVKEIKYSFNGTGYKVYSSSIPFNPAHSNVYIKAFGTDNVNNSGTPKNPSPYVRYVDTKAPTLSNSFIGKTFTTRDTTFINAETKVKLTAVDYQAGIKSLTYKLDKGGNVDYENPFTVDKEGYHDITYTGTDNVNNAADKSFFFVVDKTAPEIFTRFSIDPIGNITVGSSTTAVYPDHAGLFLSATDKMSGLDKIYYKLNDGPERLYTQMISGLKKGRTYTVSIRSVDKLGNESESKIEFSIFSEKKIASND